MFRHRFHKASSWRTHRDWMILSFLAGGVNAGGYLAAQRFVSHVTGFSTLFGIGAARGLWDQAFGILSVPIFFLFGVMLSAYLVDRKMARRERPHYAVVMALVAACLVLACVGGVAGWFGEFGNESRLQQNYLLLALLCMASGLQNAAISSASGTTVRTTHLTGLTTDLGTGLVRAMTNPLNRARELRAATLRLGLWASFALGSAVNAFIYLRFHYAGFLLPAAMAAYGSFEALRPTRRLNRLRSQRQFRRARSRGAAASPTSV